MADFTVPVLEHVADFGGAKNVVLSLLGMAPPANITLTVDEADKLTWKYSTGSLQLINTTAEAMARLGVATYMSSEINSKFFCSYMDLVKSTVVAVDRARDPQSIIKTATFGLGFRLVIVAYGLDTKFSSDMYGIAANAKVKQSSTNYQMIAIGGGLEVINAARPLITGLSGDFTMETLETIALVQRRLSQLYFGADETEGQQQPQLVPALMSVTLDLDRMANIYAGRAADAASPPRYMDVMKSQRFALEMVSSDLSCDEALLKAQTTEWGRSLDTTIVQEFYSGNLGLGASSKASSVAQGLDVLKRRVRQMREAGT